MANQRRRVLCVLPILALAAVACTQLAGQPGFTPLAATPPPPSPVATTPGVVVPAPATTVAAVTTVAAATVVRTPTFTPSPAGPGAQPCVIVVRTPPASAPTALSMGTALPRRIDPHVEVCASAATVKVGDTLTVLGQAVDIGLPYYQVRLQDQGAASSALLAEVTYENQVKSQADVSQVLALVSVTARGDSLNVVLRARGPGRTQLVVTATGEVHYGYPGPATWSGGGSDPITLTVTS